MEITLRLFESLLGKAGLPNTGDNRRLLEDAMRETLEAGRIPQKDLLEMAYETWKDPETREEFEKSVISMLLGM
ncbi:MAG: hypothetical protein ABIJ92_00360 [Candidatus Aenigmatarchaeota archaeon]